MPRRTSFVESLGNKAYFFPSAAWMGAIVFAAVRTMVVRRRVSRMGLRISFLYQF
jgi:hypothetical protein